MTGHRVPHPCHFCFAASGSSSLQTWLGTVTSVGYQSFSTCLKCHRKMQEGSGREVVLERLEGDALDLHSCSCNPLGGG